MLWLCILLPRFALEAPAGGPPQAAQAALETLALWALQWSSQVSHRHADTDADDDGCAALWLEVGANRALFGPLFGHEGALCERIAASLAPLGFSHRTGLAPTPQGAALLARADRPPHSAAALTRPQLQLLLEPLPLALLALPRAHIAALQNSGLRCIGELLALPMAAIAQRFGPDTSLYLQRLIGLAHEPLRMVRPPSRFTSRCEFAGPVADTTALLFPLQRLLAGLQGYLRSLDRAVQRYTLVLEHHRQAATRLDVGLARPGRDAAQFLALARERLTATVLSAPVQALKVEAHELLQPLILQSELFSRETQQLEQLQQVLDRLTARLGPAAVHTLHTAADHRPERAWRKTVAQPAAPHAASHATPHVAAPAPHSASQPPLRPCWLLPEPQRIAMPRELLAGPERIESGWWDSADIARDYYLAREANGARLWVFHDLRGGGWHVHGLWA